MLHGNLVLASFFLGTTTFLAAPAFLSAQATPSFELNRDTYDVYNDFTIAQGDFNNDGKPDMVLGGSTIQLRLGNGDGTFQAPIAIAPASNTIQDLVAADVNLDGRLDLLVLGVGADNLTIYFGNGDGTFQAPMEYATQNSPGSLTVGSFYGDGYLDVAAGDGNGDVEIFRNYGGKNLVLANTITVGTGSTPEVLRVRSGDLNDNGITDLAVLTGDAAYVLWNDGQGNFQPVQLATYQVPNDLSVGDLNQDGMADIIVSYTCNPTPTNNPDKGPEYNNCAGFDVFYGQGNNKTFARTVVNYNGAMPGSQPIAADVNGDGIGDIVADSTPEGYGGAGLYVWLGHPDGSFEQKPLVWVATSDNSSGLVAGDWNRDGMMDFAMPMPGSAQTQIFINGGERAPCATSQINPTVTVCQPVDYTYSNSPVTVQANAYDKTTVTAMQEYVDYNLVYSQNVSTFETTFAEPLGPHLFVTKAWDASGLSFRSDRHVTVYNGTPGPACPAAAGSADICLPSGTTSGSPVHILANGYPAWIPTAAQLYINGDLIVNNQGCDGSGSCTGGTSYVDTYQTLSPGTYDLVFKLWDADGNVYQAEKSVTVQ